MPSIGSLAVFCCEGDAQAARGKATKFKQFGANGLGFVIGPYEQPLCKFKTTNHSANRAAADAVIQTAASLVNTVVGVVRDVDNGNSIPNCFVDDYHVVSSEIVAGLAGGDTYMTVIEWDIYLPVDW